MTDIISLLIDEPALDALRQARPQAKENAQEAFEALLEGDLLTAGLRYRLALIVAEASGVEPAVAFYRDLVADEPEVAAPAALHWAYQLATRPASANAADIEELAREGWSPDQVVAMGQLIGFVAFQVRVIHGLRVMFSYEPLRDAVPRGFEVRTYPGMARPAHFVSHSLGWRPWVPPAEELTEEQRAALIKPEREKSEYFRLLARDPRALKARTLTDLDIFYNTEGGLGRAERELAATVVSRVNGCVYCASVHAGRAIQESGRREDIERLLSEGVAADLGSAQWNAVRDAARALTDTPITFNISHVRALREAGLNDTAVVDVINSAAFFQWANRLMLSLGEPELPRRFR
ncbi:alkylhydroperoxidase domain protein [Corynebacterium lowii]|uniref:Carboxymuconolactone decarboxylase family protein n=1 Tax=Corynebacterium lowii TaxID=1544413 RepID=A0A0N8VZT1_9CORY|nr:alkylhydroperoxidase domain protein [Corynebacterium lowii]KQB84762.1 Carboxymuconolactone decarboxylase family protein [Corynebacterium lowii]MDP9851665.1 alkylhydroperoxidase domain protein [Corynebacterium lowii]